MDLDEALEATASHLKRFIHFSRPEHADAVALWAAHTHVPLERLTQSPILALTSVLKQSGKSKVLDTLEFLVRDPWRISRPSESVLFRKIDRDHPTVLLDEIDTVFGDKVGNTEGIRSIFNSGNRPGAKVPRSIPAGRGYTLAEFDVFCPKATAGIGGMPETILDRAIVIQRERRARHDRVEKLRDRRARELGEPLREALAYHLSRIEDLTVADDALPAELDDRAQDGWECLIRIADVAGGVWPARARLAAICIFASRSAVDDNLGLRLLADCRAAFDALADPFVSTARLRAALIALDQSPWADIRGKEITPHYLGKLLRAFGITSRRDRPAGVGNPIHGYVRSDFNDAWERYLGSATGSGTSSTNDTSSGSDERRQERSVPKVPDVPDDRGMTLADYRKVATEALRIFGDDDDWVVGHA